MDAAAPPGAPEAEGTTLIETAAVEELRSRPGAGAHPTAEIARVVRRIGPLLAPSEVAQMTARVRATIGGLGPLDAFLADDAISDILVNGPGPVWIERLGRLQRTDVLLDEATIAALVERILGPLGRRVDPASPVVDARLPDGSRVHVVVPPVAVDGTCLAIRRFAARRVDLRSMAPPGIAEFLRWAVRARSNMVVAGGTGAGKTTLLNAMAEEIPEHERVVTVEDAAELRLPLDHVVRLETRPASTEGIGALTSRDLVRSALRMRPDRLILGEVRSGEALDMVQAMNTGHDGSLSTIHANSCDDALRRLETLVLLADVGLPLGAVRDHLAAAVDFVVHLRRCPDGSRRITSVAEVVRGDQEARERDGAAPTRCLGDEHGLRALPSRGARHPEAGPASSTWCRP